MHPQLPTPILESLKASTRRRFLQDCVRGSLTGSLLPNRLRSLFNEKGTEPKIGLPLVLVSRSGLWTGRSGAVLVEQTGIGLHQAHEILGLEDTEGS